MRISKIVSFSVVILLITVLFVGVLTVPAAAQYDTMQFRYDAAHSGDYSAVAGSVAPNNQQKWNFTTGDWIFSSPAVANGIVYIGSVDNKTYAIDAVTGTAKWSQPFVTGNSIQSSPAVANGVVYVGSNDFNVYAINASTGAAQWPHPFGTGAPSPSSPAVANGVVFVGSGDGKVYAINASSGLAQWAQPFVTGPVVSSTPAVANGVIYISSSDGNVSAIDAATGTAKWPKPFVSGASIYSDPAVANGVVYVGTNVGKLYAINATTGTAQWSQPFQTGGGLLYCSPTVANGIVYIGSDHNEYTINATTGLAQWPQPFRTGGPIESSPAVANGIVYIGSFDHKLYAIGNQSTGPSWGPWTALGGQLLAGTGPAAYTSGSTTGWFVTGTNHQLYWSTGSGWTSLGGYLTSSPSAASSGTGVIDVFVRGSDGALYWRNTSNGGTFWSNWKKIGGQLLEGTGPAAYAYGNRIGCFVTGTNHALYHIWIDTSYLGWEYFGGYLTSSPAAVSPAAGWMEVFGRGSDGALWQFEHHDGSWWPWASLGGQLLEGTGPAACSWGSGRFDVFVAGTNHALYHKSFSGSWSNWENLGGQVTSSPAATSPAANQTTVFVRGTNGALYERVYA